MNPVIQEETTGYGIPSIANILGKSYSDMKQIANKMGIYASDISLWSDTQYVRRMLAEFIVNTIRRRTPFQHGTTFLTLLFYLLSTTTKMERIFGTG